MLPLPVRNLSQAHQDHAECGEIADFATQPKAFLQGFCCPLLSTSEPQVEPQETQDSGRDENHRRVLVKAPHTLERM